MYGYKENSYWGKYMISSPGGQRLHGDAET